MSSEQWKPIGPGHWRQNEDPMLFNRPSLPGRDICDWIPDRPITPEALRQEEWVCIPEDDGVYERWLSSDEADTFVMVIIRGKEQIVSIVYGEMAYEYIEVPNCTTMAQLRALVEMLGGE